MSTNQTPSAQRAPAWLLCTVSAAALAACGGGDSFNDMAAPNAEVTASVSLAVSEDTQVAAATDIQALPAFHSAPVLLEAPDDSDATDPSATAQRPPRQQAVPSGQSGLETRQLTVQALQSLPRMRTLSAPAAGDGQASPLATGAVVATYSPAQIRAAYGLSAMPAAGSSLTTGQAAQLGAGQTIYIVNAHHNPNVVSELAAFNQKFGLPACTTRSVAVSAALPLVAASRSACEFAVVYSTAAGGRTATAPSYNAGWATEIALDVQWAHATAPLARIVLIEAPDPSVNSLADAVKLANAMGPGVVSMSFGALEGSWTASVDTAFGGAGMSYLAATGDSGAAVSWPSVSSRVLAVGGTTLRYSGGTRAEVGWTGTGGGISAHTPRPSYQAVTVPGVGTMARRSVADVAFNADPATGQYVAVMPPGSKAVNWISAGGTSLATPQWAGLLAIANAQRALAGKATLGAPHSLLYGAMASVPGTYAATFADINAGRHGSCGTCGAKTGYDAMTGLGTPRADALLSSLAGATLPATAPNISGQTVNGRVGTALSFNVNASANNPLGYSLTGAPKGLAITNVGQVTWAAPVAGTHSVTVTARDTKTGLSTNAVFTLQITKSGPTINVPTLKGVAGKALTGTIGISAPGATRVSISVSGVPSGLRLSASGMNLVATWSSPVAGNYQLKLTVVDNTGLSATAVVPIVITAK